MALNVANQENASKSLINKLNKLCGEVEALQAKLK